MELTLYKREMKGSWKLLVIFGAVLTMYVAIIISMYEPDMLKLLDSYAQAMPELMAAVGMTPGAADLLGFMISYLYGFILLVFPMVYSILRANGLVAKYVDRGSMACLLAAPVRRRTVALTQAAVLFTGTVLLVGYVTGLELAVCETSFPGELAVSELLAVNGGLLCLQLFIGGVCFLASCAFSDGKTLTKTLAMLRSGLIRTSLTVTRLPENIAMPFPRIISARSRWSSLATLSCLVLAGLSIDVYDIIVLLSFLDENVLAVDYVVLGELSCNVGELLLVDAQPVLLYHLARFSL